MGISRDRVCVGWRGEGKVHLVTFLSLRVLRRCNSFFTSSFFSHGIFVSYSHSHSSFPIIFLLFRVESVHPVMTTPATATPIGVVAVDVLEGLGQVVLHGGEGGDHGGRSEPVRDETEVSEMALDGGL